MTTKLISESNVPIINQIISSLVELKNPEKAAFLQRYFKTGPGEYGEGDIFWGITVPAQRAVAKMYYKQSDFDALTSLLDSSIHEHRVTGSMILVYQYAAAKKLGDQGKQGEIVKYYLDHFYAFNNWDLIDGTADDILGDWLWEHNRRFAYDLLESPNMREVRAGIICNLHWISKYKSVDDAYDMAPLLFVYPHHLIHKAMGWVLREAGKVDPQRLEEFLVKHWKQMPSIMRSYANEIVKVKVI